MAESIIPPRTLFRLAVPCLERKPVWPLPAAELEERFALPPLAELDGQASPADVRLAWSAGGLTVSVRVGGKRKLPRCDARRIEESDRLEIWIDTRDTHTIHRASRFCHRFAFLPTGGGQRRDQPVAETLDIDRARENPRPAAPGMLAVRSERRVDGYLMVAHIPAAVLTGYDPAEHPRLGFTYAVTDHELGLQCFSCSDSLPYASDPSVWATLDLTES